MGVDFPPRGNLGEVWGKTRGARLVCRVTTTATVAAAITVTTTKRWVGQGQGQGQVQGQGQEGQIQIALPLAAQVGTARKLFSTMTTPSPSCEWGLTAVVG